MRMASALKPNIFNRFEVVFLHWSYVGSTPHHCLARSRNATTLPSDVEPNNCDWSALLLGIPRFLEYQHGAQSREADCLHKPLRTSEFMADTVLDSRLFLAATASWLHTLLKLTWTKIKVADDEPNCQFKLVTSDMVWYASQQLHLLPHDKTRTARLCAQVLAHMQSWHRITNWNFLGRLAFFTTESHDILLVVDLYISSTHWTLPVCNSKYVE